MYKIIGRPTAADFFALRSNVQVCAHCKPLLLGEGDAPLSILPKTVPKIPLKFYVKS